MVNVLLWLVVPYFMGCVLLYLAARYLIRSFNPHPNQLIEDEDAIVDDNVADSEDVFNNNQKSADDVR